MRNPRLATVALALSIGCNSCWLHKTQSRTFIPPPPRPRPQIPTEVPEIAAAPDLDFPVNVPEELESDDPDVLRLPPPPNPQPRRPQVVTAPKAPPPVPSVEAPPQPRIGQIFTADQRREYTRTLDESLERVRKVLGAVAGKNLNSEQSEIAERIRTFQKQAEQARDQDLVTAVNLARRADLLAQDLIGRLP